MGDDDDDASEWMNEYFKIRQHNSKLLAAQSFVFIDSFERESSFASECNAS